MKDNTLKTLFTAITLIFVFISVSWAGNKDHHSCKNQSYYHKNNTHQHYNNGLNNSHPTNKYRQQNAFYNNHKQQKRHHNCNRQNHIKCYNSRSPRYGHLYLHHVCSPYRRFSAGFFNVPRFSFSFSTGDHR